MSDDLEALTCTACNGSGEGLSTRRCMFCDGSGVEYVEREPVCEEDEHERA